MRERVCAKREGIGSVYKCVSCYFARTRMLELCVRMWGDGEFGSAAAAAASVAAAATVAGFWAGRDTFLAACTPYEISQCLGVDGASTRDTR